MKKKILNTTTLWAARGPTAGRTYSLSLLIFKIDMIWPLAANSFYSFREKKNSSHSDSIQILY